MSNRAVRLAWALGCLGLAALTGCGAKTVVSTGTTASSTTVVTATTTTATTALVPTTVQTLVLATSTTQTSSTTLPPDPTAADEEQLRAMTRQELSKTGTEALINAEIPKVEVFGEWAVTSVVPPPGYENGYALFRKLDGEWSLVIGLAHHFVGAELMESGVPPDVIDAISAGYSVDPE